MSNDKEIQSPNVIIGIGASAGGLAVLKKFVKSIPKSSGMAFIIVQHLDPSHKSMLSELLSKHCTIPVEDAHNQQKVAANHVYVIPPDTYLELKDDEIILTEPTESRGSRKAIDHFFRSLAREQGDRCAGIVLSGAGSDGTAGMRTIKAAGGLALAQDPDEAEHNSMPRSAIDSNVVDQICNVTDMIELLERFSAHPMSYKYEEENEKPNREDDEKRNLAPNLEEITAILQAHEGFDLKQYKPPTIQRRIVRRMSLTGVDNFADYLHQLRENQAERKQLTADLLINITDFFRDPGAFDILEEEVLPDLLDNIDNKEDIRVWVPGCASGEEAYSIAILLVEALRKKDLKNSIKIFATDIDEHAINVARKGIYPASIAAEVPSTYLERYFIKYDNDDHYKIKSIIRDTISFAAQNIAMDPPFNHMHLISCRNLLIYLNRTVQEKVLSSFYFALEDNGYLFLGSSEALGNRADLFKTLSKKWRIYKKIPGKIERQALINHFHTDFSTTFNATQDNGNKLPYRRHRDSISRGDRMRRSILEKATPPSILVDEEGRTLYSHGDLSAFINFPPGEPRYDLIQIVKPSIRSRIRSALYKARKSSETLSFRCTLEEHDEQKDTPEKTNILVMIAPVAEPDYTDGNAYVVTFNFVSEQPSAAKESLTREEDHRAFADLELELSETREELQNTIEELETSTEELKASHEEALSTNEELQSSNEELEASAEELRSLNEELSTVNAQLKDKIDELKRANDDVENFFASTDLPTIFLDPELKIQRFTPAAELLLKMGPRDIDREIFTLGHDLIGSELAEECKEVLINFQPKHKELRDYKGNWFIRQITPYRTEDRRVEGVVLVFQDVTELKELSNRAKRRESQQSVVAKLGFLALTSSDLEHLMKQAVRQVAHVFDADYCKILKFQPEHNRLLMVAGVGWQDGLVGTATVPDSQNSQAGYTLLSQDPVIVSDLKAEKRFSGPDLLTQHKVTSGVSCLINHTNPPFGVIGVHTKDQRNFTQEDANFLLSVANMLSTAIQAQESRNYIRDSESKLRLAKEAGNLSIFDYDIILNNISLEPRLLEIWGFSKNELITVEKTLSRVHPDDLHAVRKSIEHSTDVAGSGNLLSTFRVIEKQSSKVIWLEARGQVYFQDEKPTRMIGMITEVTERVQQQRALEQSEQRLNMASAAGQIGIHDYDILNNTIIWDEYVCKIWGVPLNLNPITYDTFEQALHPDDRARIKSEVTQALKHPGDYHWEYRVINQQDQSLRWVHATGRVLHHRGEAVRLVGTVQDVTQRKIDALEIQKSEQKLRNITDNMAAFIGQLDLNGTLTDTNYSSLHAAGIQREDVIGKKYWDCYWWSYDEGVQERLKQAFHESIDGKLVRYDETIRVANNRRAIIDFMLSPVTNEEGEVIYVIPSAIDVSERKELETSLKQAVSKLKETDVKKNEFLSILGHELRNPLAALNGSIEILERVPERSDSVFHVMKHSVGTMSRLLDDLLDLDRVSQNKIHLVKKPVHLKAIIDNVEKLTQDYFVRNHQKFAKSVDEKVWIMGDETRLEQVFANLVINASKYTPENGEVLLTAKQVGERLTVEITDSGIGLETEDIQKIFDPFYQVKLEGQAPHGLGVGLALVKKLIEMHQGTVTAYSEGRNKGSTFCVTLPAQSVIVPDRQTNHDEQASLRPGLKVLVVDDNRDVLQTLPVLLQSIECQVETASCAIEAIAKVDSFAPDAMLVDIGLPDLSGHELAKRVRKKGYQGLMVALSGYSHKQVQEESREVGFDDHLAKPATFQQLQNLLRKIQD